MVTQGERGGVVRTTNGGQGEQTLRELRRLGRLEKVDAAGGQMGRSMAGGLGEDPSNAGLGRREPESAGKDARDKWLDELFPLIRRSRKLRPLIGRIYEGMGNEYVKFANGSLIRLLSTSTSSGHSKTLHQAVLDEIWHDQDGRREQGLRPAMLTVRDAQILVCSTAGNATSVVLDRKIEQGRAAVEADSGRGIAYIE